MIEVDVARLHLKLSSLKAERPTVAGCRVECYLNSSKSHKSINFQSAHAVPHVACLRWAAQKSSQDVAWAANLSKNTTKRRIIAGAGAPLLVSFVWYDSRSGAPPWPALPPHSQTCSDRAWAYPPARHVWLRQLEPGLWNRTQVQVTGWVAFGLRMILHLCTHSQICCASLMRKKRILSCARLTQ